jgi:DNA-binding CsgD family transcriptional regulator
MAQRRPAPADAIGETTDPNTTRLASELKGLRRVLAVTAIKGMLQKEQIDFLSKAGISNADIADMVGTSRHNVDQTLHAIRKDRNKARGRAAKKRKS